MSRAKPAKFIRIITAFASKPSTFPIRPTSRTFPRQSCVRAKNTTQRRYSSSRQNKIFRITTHPAYSLSELPLSVCHSFASLKDRSEVKPKNLVLILMDTTQMLHCVQHDNLERSVQRF